jgi:hypothetical protein
VQAGADAAFARTYFARQLIRRHRKFASAGLTRHGLDLLPLRAMSLISAATAHSVGSLQAPRPLKHEPRLHHNFTAIALNTSSPQQEDSAVKKMGGPQRAYFAVLARIASPKINFTAEGVGI